MLGKKKKEKSVGTFRDFLELGNQRHTRNSWDWIALKTAGARTCKIECCCHKIPPSSSFQKIFYFPQFPRLLFPRHCFLYSMIKLYGFYTLKTFSPLSPVTIKANGLSQLIDKFLSNEKRSNNFFFLIRFASLLMIFLALARNQFNS